MLQELRFLASYKDEHLKMLFDVSDILAMLRSSNGITDSYSRSRLKAAATVRAKSIHPLRCGPRWDDKHS